MAIRNNPSTVSSNTVFTYDVADIRNSYPGEPTTNYLTTALAPNNASKESFSGTVTDNAEFAPDGTLTAARFVVNSGYVYEVLSIPAGTTINYSVWIKMLDGNTTTSVGPYIWSYGGPATGIVSRDLSGLSTNWKRFSMSYTTLSGQSSFAISYAATNGGLYGTYAFWRPQLEYKNHATPFVFGTRSSTQGLLDVSGYNRSINLSNVSFDLNAQITFDGTDDYIEASSFNVNENNEFTLEAIIYPSTVSGDKSIINKRTQNDFWPAFQMSLENNNLAGYYSSPTYGQCLEGAIGTSGIITAGRYHHVAFSKGAGGYTTMKLFINGVSVPYNNFLYGSHVNGIASSTRPIHVGRTFDTPNWIQPFSGLIPISKVYNRQLTDAEMLSNFNNYKKRFNL